MLQAPFIGASAILWIHAPCTSRIRSGKYTGSVSCGVLTLCSGDRHQGCGSEMTTSNALHRRVCAHGYLYRPPAWRWLVATSAITSTLLHGSIAARVEIAVGVEFSASPFLFTDVAYQAGDGAYRNVRNASQPATTDSNGWPTEDANVVIFDNRCFGAWNPPPDDPWCWQAPLEGVWYFNLTGNASVVITSNPTSLLNISFDVGTYTTGGYFTFSTGQPDLLELGITDTRRNATSPLNSGFTGLRVMLPGHTTDAPRQWVPELITAVQPFDHFRFMGITGTNTGPGYYGDAGHHFLDFTNRCLPTDAVLGVANARSGCWGLPWEYVVSAAQVTGKGVWINSPISATVSFPVNVSSYVYQMAQLFKSGNAFTGGRGMPPAAPIFLEHSNEVWNFGFQQYIYNKLAAMDECNSTVRIIPCLWNNDGVNNSETWAQRRHLGKVYEIGQTFLSVFGASAFPTVIRPVYADWTIFPDRYNATLAWANATYGPPATFLYGMAATGERPHSPSRPRCSSIPPHVCRRKNTSLIVWDCGLNVRYAS